MTSLSATSMTAGGAHACRGELLGQSRRGALTDAGRLALDAHLVGCASCRLARDVLADFDQVDVVDIRDGARVRALVDAARAARVSAGAGARGGVRSQRRFRAAAAAAVVLICGGSASAAVWWWRHPAPVASVVAPRPGQPTLVVRGAAPARVSVPAAVAVAPPPAPPREPARGPSRRLSARSMPLPADTRVSAAALLAEAGRARGEGQLDRATKLYRRLQREFPGTPEAMVSSVPLGRLLLDGGAARAALAAFDGYLRDVPGGPLIAEALFGKGRALESLGDRDEERRTWERLVADPAGSAYLPHAQRRLAALR